MLQEHLIDFIKVTLQQFPEYQGDEFVMTPLEKGGSGRHFYRICVAGGASVILIQYTQEREENRHYVDIARFLDGAGIQVPRVYFHDTEGGLILMQDLGEQDLWSYRNHPWSKKKPLYESALSQIAAMHTLATQSFSAEKLPVQREFNEQLYLWEQHYFLEHCVEGIWGLSPTALRELPAFQDIVTQLSALPRVLVHRDFQSQNILISSDTAWLIDFQGMRPGLGLYDVASLLYDPYVSLTSPERQQLLGYYRSLLESAGEKIDFNFEEIFLMCAVQRLMQALGAYGFLGLKKGKADFLGYVPMAKKSLKEVASQIFGLEALVETLNQAA